MLKTAAPGVGERIRDRLSDQASADRWIGRMAQNAQIEWAGSRLLVLAPTRFEAEALRRRLSQPLTSLAREESGNPDATVDFAVAPAASAPPPAEAPEAIADVPAPRRRHSPSARREPAMKRLEDFVRGPSNEIAFDAAQRLANPDDDSAAPLLFIHGECGLGKTHLLQGVAERFRERRPGARLRWTTGEAFTNAYIAAVQANRVDAFRRAHRDLDLLCVDDVHFLAGKSGTQTELLHTLDAVGACGARLALASDAHPRQIRDFSERLVSRFLAGLVTEVRRPDLATRTEIVRRLLHRRGLAIDATAASVIADRRDGSVRDLEGAVVQVEATHRLLGATADEPLSLATIERALGPAPVRKPLAVRDIARKVGEALTVDLDDLFGKSRHQRVVLARSMTAFLARELTTHSYPEIARELNKPNHSTIITACNRVRDQIAADEPCPPFDRAGVWASMRAVYEGLKREVLASVRPS